MALDIVDTLTFKDLALYQTNGYIKNILVLSNNDKQVISKNQLDLIYKVSHITIDALDELAKSINVSINKNFNLMLFLSDKQKKFPSSTENCITESHVNSAATHLLTIPFIKIFRSEEMIKVLIHEIIHAAGFDKIFGNIDQTKYHFKVNTPLLFQEIIAETLAEYINCVFYSKIYNQDFKQILNKELDFGFLETAKILNHFKFTNMDDFIKNDNDTREICQKTAVLEYHILKTALLYNFDKFMTIIKKHGNASDIFDLIIQTLQSPLYQNRINLIIKNLASYDRELLGTFKMSIINIERNHSVTQSGRAFYKNKYYKYKHKYLNYKKNFL